MNWTVVGHKVAEYGKAVVAFLVPIVLQVAADLVNNADPWPDTLTGWVKFVLPSVLTALGVVVVPNRPQIGQVERAVDKLGVARVQAVVDTASAAA